MAVQRSTPELADRLATYVEELREFFVSCGMHYGSADDIAPLIARLDDGSYGRCESCGTIIADDRLAETPTARTCAGCPVPGAG